MSAVSRVNHDYERDFNPNDPYEQIRMDQNAENDDIICDVCLEDDDDQGDEIVICGLCQCAIHQTCYGGDLIGSLTEGEWYCQRCAELRLKPDITCNQIKCFLCPDIDGIIKKVSTDQ